MLYNHFRRSTKNLAMVEPNRIPKLLTIHHLPFLHNKPTLKCVFNLGSINIYVSLIVVQSISIINWKTLCCQERTATPQLMNPMTEQNSMTSIYSIYIWTDLSHTKSIAISRSIAIWIGSPGQNDFLISFKVGYHDPIPRNFTLPHLHSSNSYDLIKGHLNTLNPVHSFTLLDHHHYYYCWDGNIHSFTTYRGSSSPERVTCGNLSIHGSCKLSLFLSFCTFRIFA